jgi:hypothetical protein
VRTHRSPGFAIERRDKIRLEKIYASGTEEIKKHEKIWQEAFKLR